MNNDQLQQAQYKNALFNTLQSQGLVSQLKLQLRQKLLEKLKNKKTQIYSDDDQFLKRVITSLFKDYLIIKGMSYSLSVYLPQSGLVNGCFEREQIISMFDVNPGQNSIIQALVNNKIPGRGYLSNHQETGVQTIDSDKILSLQLKLSQIDKNYQKSLAKQKPVNLEDIQQRYLNYQLETQKRFKRQLEKEIKRIKEFQIVEVKRQMQQKNRVNFREYSSQLDRKYSEKLAKLRDRQKQTIDLVNHKTKMLEQADYQHRQKLLVQMQTVKQKQIGVQKQRIKNQQFLRSQQQKIRRLQKQLADKMNKI